MENESPRPSTPTTCAKNDSSKAELLTTKHPDPPPYASNYESPNPSYHSPAALSALAEKDGSPNSDSSGSTIIADDYTPGGRLYGTLPKNLRVPAIDDPFVDTSSPSKLSKYESDVFKRENWIKTRAQRIVKLARIKEVTEQRVMRSGSCADYVAWQAAKSAFEDETSLAKKQEERRNLLMPGKMKALKTGPYNLPGDGHAGLARYDTGDGVLLGSQMALMERQCAAVARERDDNNREEERWRMNGRV